MYQLYKFLTTPEKSGRKIGIFRTSLSIFGGLIVSYLGMTLLAFIIPSDISKSAIISLLFNSFVWAASATWILLSYTKLEALLKCLIPTIVFSILIYLFYEGLI